MMKLHRLRNRGARGAEPLTILSGGAGVLFSPQKILYPYKKLD